ncbi:16S rRNA (guanine(966)-N(2))-methyltransferase RsmD [Arhodomonas aquaeolei]|uniref:16S rRNA (guanine(966)-N(2))-methyltransferase RsmD n=2 Tax=Ectothiorhodospiraceae TaxID=72276 RepID=UPI002168D4D9|nr:16S rRNA (guanine(966)-N(2))-methyltransferase RsmD [Arhodomonas aquaeolei]MCS4503005.1 16S rRNA (guanine(966)-N(2))-methyltransferase RsmD [Arhodomonas aquaeolei]
MAARNRLRIVAGEWGGRRLPFPDARGLRPTAERVRETLFNWLRAEVAGARCLDLFAGSGALGLEAASRGAREVVCVERSRRVAGVLRENVERLDGGGRVSVAVADARRYLDGPASPFDLVFLDPPFSSSIIDPVCAGLEAGGWLSPRAFVYVERALHGQAVTVPASWGLWRHGSAGDVDYRLYQRQIEE